MTNHQDAWHPSQLEQLFPLQVLGCYAQMASGQEEDVEAAVKQLLELAGQQRDSVPVLLALASGFMLKKHTPKAR